jgi:hypothetical protein
VGTQVNDAVIRANPKLANLDLSRLLVRAEAHTGESGHICSAVQDHGLETGLDPALLPKVKEALQLRLPIVVKSKIVNENRAVGTTISHEVSHRFSICLSIPPRRRLGETLCVVLYGQGSRVSVSFRGCACVCGEGGCARVCLAVLELRGKGAFAHLPPLSKGRVFQGCLPKRIGAGRCFGKGGRGL